jgi:ATP dependent DNA ligase C terminal region
VSLPKTLLAHRWNPMTPQGPPLTRLKFIEPMYARLVHELPEGKEWLYKVEFGGVEIDTCPFANLPEKKRTQWALTKEEMKNCVWLKPEFVGQIEFTEWTPDGHLRHSKFVGLREDKGARDVVKE